MILPVPTCSSQSTLSLWMFPQRLLARCSLCWMVAQHKISQKYINNHQTCTKGCQASTSTSAFLTSSVESPVFCVTKHLTLSLCHADHIRGFQFSNGFLTWILTKSRRTDLSGTLLAFRSFPARSVLGPTNDEKMCDAD